MSVTPDAYASGHEGWLAYQRHNFFIVKIVFLCALQFLRLLRFCEWLKLYLCIIRMVFAYFFFPPLATMSILQCSMLMVGFTSALLTSVPQTSVSPVGGTASPGRSGRRAGLKLEFRSQSLASRWEEAANSSFPMWAWMTGIMPCTCMVLLHTTCVRALKGEQVLSSCCWGAAGTDRRELQPLCSSGAATSLRQEVLCFLAPRVRWFLASLCKSNILHEVNQAALSTRWFNSWLLWQFTFHPPGFQCDWGYFCSIFPPHLFISSKLLRFWLKFYEKLF